MLKSSLNLAQPVAGILPSLISRIVALGALVVCILMIFAILIVDASVKTRRNFVWVTHSAKVIDTGEDALIKLQDAESGQRGFVITYNPDFALVRGAGRQF